MRNKPNVPVGGKLPPQAIDLEAAVIGSILLENKVFPKVMEYVKSMHVFYVPANQIIFKACKMLFQESQPIDLLTVTNKLRSMGKLEEIGGAFYITDLVSAVSSSANIEFHLKILLQKYAAREVITGSMVLIEEAYDDTNDIADTLNKGNILFSQLLVGDGTKKARSINDIGMERIREYAKFNGVEIMGIPSGLTDLDHFTGGSHDTDLIILAGRPAMGKTSLACQMGVNAAIMFKKKIGIFSLEMSEKQIFDKILAQVIQISVQDIRKGKLTEADHLRIQNEAQKVLDADIIIDDTPGININEFKIRARRMVEEHGIEMIIIDYLQLMSGFDQNRGANKAANKDVEIGDITKGLKAIAKELKVPVLALSQLSRAVETRGGNKKPMLSDLRESGNIEQDADVVMFVYRPEYYGFETDAEGNSVKGVAQVLIAKNRQGAVNTDGINLRWQAFNTAFYDYRPNEENIDPYKLSQNTWQSKLDNKDETPGTFTIRPSTNFSDDIKDEPF